MTERWMCMDCSAWTELNKHGRCGTCNSDAVISSEAHKPCEWPANERQAVRELIRMFAL